MNLTLNENQNLLINSYTNTLDSNESQNFIEGYKLQKQTAKEIICKVTDIVIKWQALDT